MPKIDTIIFDLGGVLIDWNPRYLYRKLFATEEEVTWFLETVCTPQWNAKQDAGRPSGQAIEELTRQFPTHEAAIHAWFSRWDETIGGSIQETVEVLRALRESKKYRLYALTNWSAETFPWATKRFEFLRWFEGIVMSGEEKTLKPRPEFYHVLFTRYSVDPEQSLFIDDNQENVDAARRLGMDSIQFVSASQLNQELAKRGIQTLRI